MVTILHEGDYHSGHRLGLTPPRLVAPEFEPILGKLWAWRAKELAAVGKVDIHILDGDLVDGPGFKGSMAHLTTNMDEQAEMAIEAVEMVKAKHRFFTYGSDYHVVQHANTEARIARHFGSEIRDTVLLKAGGKRFNFRHFVGRSDIERGQFTQDARELTRALIREALDGEEAADIFGRSHVHYWSRVDVKDRTVYTSPAWQLPLDIPGSTYPRKLRTQYYDVGYTLIQIDQHGEVYIRPRRLKVSAEFPRRYECPAL